VPARWINSVCAVCGATDGTPAVRVPHPDAPEGMSFVWQCAQCGLRRLHPRPAPESLGAYYNQGGWYNAYVGRIRSARSQRLWDLMRDSFSRPAGASWSSRILGPLLAPLARYQFDLNVPLNGRRGLRVLEVGSGFGDVLIYLRSRGCEVLGTDLEPNAAEAGRAQGVEIRIGNLVDLALPSESFDVGMMCHSLEHVPDPNVELAELRRVLRPGAQLQIAVPNGAAVRLAMDGPDWWHLSHPLHFWYFDPENLANLVRKHGFEPTRVSSVLRPNVLAAWKFDRKKHGLGGATRRLTEVSGATLKSGLRGDSLRLTAIRR
jgi:SAM-dependent methyltransferase